MTAPASDDDEPRRPFARTQAVELAELRIGIRQMREEMARLRADFEEYVTHSEFFPVKLIAYGLAGGVMLTVLGALLTKVIAP